MLWRSKWHAIQNWKGGDFLFLIKLFTVMSSYKGEKKNLS